MMIKPIIHFAHANGFPAKTYSKIFSRLEPQFQIKYLERHAHNPLFPVTDGWIFLRDELQTAIENNYHQPVIGLGHSLGGILHLLVAARKPELYSQIILLDAPIISRLSSRGLQFLKITKKIDRYTPSFMTKVRRSFWTDKAAAFEHFRGKPKFAAFDQAVLRDYVEHGTTATENGVKLFFDQQIEAQIYRTIPHDLPKLRGKFAVPLTYIGGTRSREAELARLSFMRKHFAVNFQQIEGTHLFPFEKPIETAEKICGSIHNFPKDY